MTNAPKKRMIKTTKTVIDIIEVLDEYDGARITQISKELDIAKSTVHRHLSTLLKHEYVTKEGDMYKVGFRFLYLGIQTRRRREAYCIIKKEVQKLSKITGERTQFVVEEHGRGVLMFLAFGEDAVGTATEVGETVPLHASSAGKSILAFLPEEESTQIIDDRGLPPVAANTFTSRNALLEELEEIRDRGVAINREELFEGLCAFGVPITDRDDQVLGGLSITGPVHRLKRPQSENELSELLLSTANEIELKINKPP